MRPRLSYCCSLRPVVAVGLPCSPASYFVMRASFNLIVAPLAALCLSTRNPVNGCSLKMNLRLKD